MYALRPGPSDTYVAASTPHASAFCSTAGDRVVIVGDGDVQDQQTGATHRAEWAWVHDLHDGLITRLVVIQDLTRVADAVRAVISKAQSGNERAAWSRLGEQLVSAA
jgi:hypothetical protein